MNKLIGNTVVCINKLIEYGTDTRLIVKLTSTSPDFKPYKTEKNALTHHQIKNSSIAGKMFVKAITIRNGSTNKQYDRYYATYVKTLQEFTSGINYASEYQNYLNNKKAILHKGLYYLVTPFNILDIPKLPKKRKEIKENTVVIDLDKKFIDYKEIIKAYFEGEEIQVYSKVSVYPTEKDWIKVTNPSWTSYLKYRVKPKTLFTNKLGEIFTNLDEKKRFWYATKKEHGKGVIISLSEETATFLDYKETTDKTTQAAKSFSSALKLAGDFSF